MKTPSSTVGQREPNAEHGPAEIQLLSLHYGIFTRSQGKGSAAGGATAPPESKARRDNVYPRAEDADRCLAEFHMQTIGEDQCPFWVPSSDRIFLLDEVHRGKTIGYTKWGFRVAPDGDDSVVSRPWRSNPLHRDDLCIAPRYNTNVKPDSSWSGKDWR